MKRADQIGKPRVVFAANKIVQPKNQSQPGLSGKSFKPSTRRPVWLAKYMVASSIMTMANKIKKPPQTALWLWSSEATMSCQDDQRVTKPLHCLTRQANMALDTSNKWTINAQLCALNLPPSSLVPLDLLRFFLVLVLTHSVPERRQKTTRRVVVHVCIRTNVMISSHVLRMLVQVVSTFSRPVSCLFGQVCRHKNMCLFDISASSTNFHVSGMCASSRHVNIPAHNISFIASSMSKSSRNLLFLGHPVCVQIQLLTPLNPAMTWSCKGALEKHPLSCCYLEWEERVRKNTMAHIFQWVGNWHTKRSRCRVFGIKMCFRMPRICFFPHLCCFPASKENFQMAFNHRSILSAPTFWANPRRVCRTIQKKNSTP